MIIDIHSHFFPQELIDQARNGKAVDGLSIFNKGNEEFVQHRQGARYPLAREFYDRDVKLERMSALDIDVSILSAAPPLFMYWLDKNEGSEFCAWMNDRLAEFIQPSAGKLFGLAAVPLQDPDSAIRELRRAILELKFSGVQIGTSIESIPLDDHIFNPFFEEASQLGIPLLLHPFAIGKRERMEEFHLNNLVGNPLDTELAAARMIFSGFLDRFPDLKIILVHGGRFLPYQIGRFNHTYSSLPEKERPAHPPEVYLQRFYYDTVLFEHEPLKFLCKKAGPEQIMVGTDSPFAAQDINFKQNVESLDIAESEKELIFSGNACKIFDLRF